MFHLKSSSQNGNLIGEEWPGSKWSCWQSPILKTRTSLWIWKSRIHDKYGLFWYFLWEKFFRERFCQQLQNDPGYFSVIKDCVYSTFWAFRYVRAYGGVSAYIAVKGEHLGIPENQRTKSVRWFFYINSNFYCARSSGQIDHLITRIGPKQMHFRKDPLPLKPSCHRENLINSVW